MADMILKLNGPGMTSLHKVGLAGLYMTLKAFDESKTRIDELKWALHPDRIALEWQSENRKKALDQLVKKSFQIDNEGFFRLPGLERRQPSTVEQKHIYYTALLNTFLQFGPHRPTGTRRTLRYKVDDKVCLINGFAPITEYRHQQAAEVFLNKDGKFVSDVEVAGWLYPGAGQRHVVHADSKFTEQPEHALCLLFAPVGCVFFQVTSKTAGRKARAALVIPEVWDLGEYAALREYIARSGALALTASGASDAALRFIATMRTATVGTEFARMSVRNVPCRVITFGIVGWNEKQKSRTMARTVVPATLKDIDNYTLADAIFRNRWQRVAEKRNRRGEVTEPEHHFIITSSARELIAENIARGAAWFDGFSQYMANKQTRTQLIYEREELNKMVTEGTFDDARERTFIAACHEAWRRRLGKLGERSRRENASFPALVNREQEKLRVALSRCKNAATLRETVVDFWSRAGSIQELHDHWQEVLALMDDKNWRKGKDLALLALASYKPSGRDDEDGMMAHATQEMEGDDNE